MMKHWCISSNFSKTSQQTSNLFITSRPVEFGHLQKWGPGVWSPRHQNWGLGFGVWGLGFWIRDMGSGVSGLLSGTCGLEFETGVWDSRSGIEGLVFGK